MSTFSSDECVPLFGSHRNYCYYLKTNGVTINVFTRQSEGRVVSGVVDESSCLYVDNVWPGSVVVSDFLDNCCSLCFDKNVLELGAG